MRAAVVAAAMALASPAGALAQEDADALAKALANPVASLVSVPFQLNRDFGYGDGDEGGTRVFLNFQPVVPSSIGERWNLITRLIVPVVYQDEVLPGTEQHGLGDTTPTFFFSPKAPGPGGLIWGAGPVLLLPTATDEALGAEKWGVGPSVVLLRQTASRWTYGVLANHVESIAGDDLRDDVSTTFLQPILAKNLPGGRTIGGNFEATYDWERGQWTAPLNVYYSKVTRIGEQMLSLQGGARAYLARPDGGPDWGLRFAVTLLFPRG